MRALAFGISIPRVLMGKMFRRYSDSVVFGKLSGVSLEDIPVPKLPGADWVELEVIMCGICGSDTAGLAFKTSPVLEPFLSLPAILGHEILARVSKVGSGVTKVKVGDRVVVDPTISCTVRGRATGEQSPLALPAFPQLVRMRARPVAPLPMANHSPPASYSEPIPTCREASARALLRTKVSYSRSTRKSKTKWPYSSSR